MLEKVFPFTLTLLYSYERLFVCTVQQPVVQLTISRLISCPRLFLRVIVQRNVLNSLWFQLLCFSKEKVVSCSLSSIFNRVGVQLHFNQLLIGELKMTNSQSIHRKVTVNNFDSC